MIATRGSLRLQLTRESERFTGIERRVLVYSTGPRSAVVWRSDIYLYDEAHDSYTALLLCHDGGACRVFYYPTAGAAMHAARRWVDGHAQAQRDLPEAPVWRGGDPAPQGRE